MDFFSFFKNVQSFTTVFGHLQQVHNKRKNGPEIDWTGISTRRLNLAPTWFLTQPKPYLQHEIFTPFRVERLPTHACGLDESCGHGRYAVPMFSAPVTAATALATPRAAAWAASSVFPFKTQPETETCANGNC